MAKDPIAQAFFTRWRQRLWRFRVPLALLYFVGLGASWVLLFQYRRFVPPEVDLGLTIVARSTAYHSTFREVEKARGEQAAGDLAAAVERLEHFVSRHADVQPAQRFTHAVTDAEVLLAECLMELGSRGRAERVLETTTARCPLDWWPWFQLGDVREERGDLEGAAEAYLRAFRLTGNHAEVATKTIDVLADLLRHAELVQVAEEFEAACSFAAPLVDVKVGIPRTSLQRRALRFAGVDVEHGSFRKSARLWGLARGSDVTVDLPIELLGRRRPGETVAVQLRFHNVYSDLRLDSVRWHGANGELGRQEFGEGEVAELHRQHSGGDWYLEFHVPLPEGEWTAWSVGYSCPEQQLSDAVLARVESARRNLAARGAP